MPSHCRLRSHPFDCVANVLLAQSLEQQGCAIERSGIEACGLPRGKGV